MMNADRIKSLIATMRAEHAAMSQVESLQEWLACPCLIEKPDDSNNVAWTTWIVNAHERELEVANALEALLAENQRHRKWADEQMETLRQELQEARNDRGKLHLLVDKRDARIERLERPMLTVRNYMRWSLTEPSTTIEFAEMTQKLTDALEESTPADRS